ncbi:MAG: APC family permease [Candidatus Theseobacter exili]|nr:APC family permease [Candidatus Theseobacter exili]
MAEKSNTNKSILGVFSLAMINVAAIMSLKNLPMMADYGLALIFFISFAAIAFFVPTALISAELATGWPGTIEPGGVYLWVKEGFGARLGFLAVWLQWVEDVVWFPTILSFAAATFAYVINPALADNKVYMVSVILVTLWGATLANFRGMRLSSVISSIGSIAGTIVPGTLIIILGLIWVIEGGQSQIDFSVKKLIPNLTDIRQLILLSGMFLSFTGMEMSAVHAQEVKNPQRDYPKAIFLSTFIILLLCIAGSLSIAIVVPQKNISLVAGVMEAFELFFSAHNMKWIVPWIAILTAGGGVAMLSTWIVGPTKGLLATSKDGSIPPFFQRTNRYGMPTNILLVQAGIVSLFSLVFLLMPTVSSSFWILTVLTAQVYLIMYILMFISAIKLKYSQPDTPRSYKVPGGIMGMWLIGGTGTISSLFAIFMGFWPPKQIDTIQELVFYELFLFLGIAVLCLPPFVLYALRKTEWAKDVKKQE